jgi:hypothetical protein
MCWARPACHDRLVPAAHFPDLQTAIDCARQSRETATATIERSAERPGEREKYPRSDHRIASDPMAVLVMMDIEMVGLVNASRTKVGHRDNRICPRRLYNKALGHKNSR